jgi:hypothetical protein
MSCLPDTTFALQRGIKHLRIWKAGREKGGRSEDRVLQAIIRKSKNIRKELGSATQVIEPKLDILLRSGISRSKEAELLAKVNALDASAEERQAIDEELESGRKRELALREELEVPAGVHHFTPVFVRIGTTREGAGAKSQSSWSERSLAFQAAHNNQNGGHQL